MDRQISLIDDQLDIFDALADQPTETAEEVTEVLPWAPKPTTTPALFEIPATAAQLLIGENIEEFPTVAYAVHIDAEGLACYRPVA